MNETVCTEYFDAASRTLAGIELLADSDHIVRQFDGLEADFESTLLRHKVASDNEIVVLAGPHFESQFRELRDTAKRWLELNSKDGALRFWEDANRSNLGNYRYIVQNLTVAGLIFAVCSRLTEVFVNLDNGYQGTGYGVCKLEIPEDLIPGIRAKIGDEGIRQLKANASIVRCSIGQMKAAGLFKLDFGLLQSALHREWINARVETKSQASRIEAKDGPATLFSDLLRRVKRQSDWTATVRFSAPESELAKTPSGVFRGWMKEIFEFQNSPSDLPIDVSTAVAVSSELITGEDGSQIYAESVTCTDPVTGRPVTLEVISYRSIEIAVDADGQTFLVLQLENSLAKQAFENVAKCLEDWIEFFNAEMRNNAKEIIQQEKLNGESKNLVNHSPTNGELDNPKNADSWIVHASGFSFQPNGFARFNDLEIPLKGRSVLAMRLLCESRFGVLRSDLADAISESGEILTDDRIRGILLELRKQLKTGFKLDFDPVPACSTGDQTRWQLAATAQESAKSSPRKSKRKKNAKRTPGKR